MTSAKHPISRCLFCLFAVLLLLLIIITIIRTKNAPDLPSSAPSCGSNLRRLSFPHSQNWSWRPACEETAESQWSPNCRYSSSHIKKVCVCVNTWHVLYLMSVCAGTLYMYIIYIQLYIYMCVCVHVCIYLLSKCSCQSSACFYLYKYNENTSKKNSDWIKSTWACQTPTVDSLMNYCQCCHHQSCCGQHCQHHQGIPSSIKWHKQFGYPRNIHQTICFHMKVLKYNLQLDQIKCWNCLQVLATVCPAWKRSDRSPRMILA